MTSSLVPSSSAAHGITYSQNVARDVAERIDQMRARTSRSRVGAWVSFVAPPLVTAMLAVTDAWPAAFLTGYVALMVMPVGYVVHRYRRRALAQADVLDRSRDVSWVSMKDGLIFFSDDGVFVEKRGGFRPYGVGMRRFSNVSVVGDVLTLSGYASDTGASYAMDVRVPPGWTDVDTKRIREKLESFVPEP